LLPIISWVCTSRAFSVDFMFHFNIYFSRVVVFVLQLLCYWACHCWLQSHLDQRGENFVELSYIWNEWIDEITKFVCWARSIYFFLNLSLLKLQRSLFFNNLLTVFLVSTLKKSDLLHHFQKVTFFQSVCYSYSSKMSIHHCNDLTLIHYKAMMFL
jgi:hypothetical protein